MHIYTDKISSSRKKEKNSIFEMYRQNRGKIKPLKGRVNGKQLSEVKLETIKNDSEEIKKAAIIEKQIKVNIDC